MKIISLCGGRKCCPVLMLRNDGGVNIGEGKDSAHLTKEQWEILKKKIKDNEV